TKAEERLKRNEWETQTRKRERAGSKENYKKRKCKVLAENWRMVEDTNSFVKSSGKSFQYLERHEESGSSDSKEGKHVCLIPTDMLEEMVCPEASISKEKEHIAKNVVIEDIDVGMIRQQKLGREIEETLEQQLQSNRERDTKEGTEV
ncbi:6191_t:CDS:2, partial [Gigaspora rosea]